MRGLGADGARAASAPEMGTVKQLPRLRLRLDPILCDGAGYCAELVPERVSFDDWGYPIVDPRAIDDARCLRHARRAVAECPRVALRLEDTSAG